MLTVDEAQKEVLARAGPLPRHRKNLSDALGCILTEDIHADLDLPPFDKALVDGYAVRSADLGGDPPYRLRIGEEITAGQTPSRPLQPGEAATIMTGAPLPAGADSVVMIELTRRLDDGRVAIESQVVPGQNRLARGREMRLGEIVLRPGTPLNAARLGLLASVGRTRVEVVPRPRLAIVPTGDELVRPSEAPGPGQIRETNSLVLAALAQRCDARAVARPIAPDEFEALRRALKAGLDEDRTLGEADILMISGGVSAGKRDLVPAALESLGVRPVFHKVRLRPGKPLWFGVGPERPDPGGERTPRPGALVFGLPGNPVSGIVCFLLFVRPAIEALRGGPVGPSPIQPGRLAARFVHRGDRPTYHPARRILPDEGPPLVEPLDWAGSADLRTVASADGFAVFPAGDRTFEAGEEVGFLPMP